MNCKTFKNIFLDYYFKELNEEQSEKIQQHLMICEHCAKFYHQINNLFISIKNREYMQPDAFYVSRLSAKIENQLFYEHKKNKYIPALIKPVVILSFILLGVILGSILSVNISSMKTNSYVSSEQQIAEEYGLFSKNDQVLENMYK